MLKAENRGRKKSWSEDENKRLFEAVERFGKDWDKIADYVGSKNKNQV